MIKKIILECKGKEITSLQDAEHFVGCNIVEGSLEIYFHTTVNSENVVERLTESLKDVHVVRDFVKITFSHSFVTLRMFKNLQEIQGVQLWKEKFANLINNLKKI